MRRKGSSVQGRESVELDALLNTKSAKEMESKRIGEEIEILLGTQTIKEKSLAQKFKSNDAVKVLLHLYLYTHYYSHCI